MTEAPGSVLARFWKFVWSWYPILFVHMMVPYNVYREFWKRPKKFEEMPDRSGEVAVLTGGTKGIGKQVLKKLLQAKFHVVVGCRSPKDGETVIKIIRSSGVTTGSTKVFELDLKSLSSVRKFAQCVNKDVKRIDLLINNAGIMFGSYELTEDGYESQFQVNYLSHFLLTQELLPKIKETSKLPQKHVACRIVNVASDANYGADLNFNDLEECKVYASNKSYSDSKLCQIMHARYLDKLLSSDKDNVKVNAYSLHPGAIYSELWKNIGLIAYTLSGLVKFLLKTPEDGADTVLYTALSPELEGTGGVFINNCEVVKPHKQATDVGLQKKLFERSMELCA